MRSDGKSRRARDLRSVLLDIEPEPSSWRTLLKRPMPLRVLGLGSAVCLALWLLRMALWAVSPWSGPSLGQVLSEGARALIPAALWLFLIFGPDKESKD